MQVLERGVVTAKDYNTVEEVVAWAENSEGLILSDEAIQRIIQCRSYLDQKLKDGDQTYYGINTGFGYLQKIKIDDEQISKIQHNLILSHACGLGDEVPEVIVRYMMLLKIKSLAAGHSGVRMETVNRLTEMVKQGMHPVIYSQGSLGASGDLCPLSHMV